jgi:sigma-B regulation protein RsbU (phosphoserine phosphatase)
MDAVLLESPLLPDNEAERIAAVRRYDVLDTPPDGAFDRVTALAARHFGVPICIVSIVDTDRIWFKSHHGVDVDEIGRDPGLCASAILQHGPWVVEDASTDPRTLANPLVAGDLGLRFYAGVPLTTGDGFNLGTLCVIDQHPRRLSEQDTATLTDMAAIVMDELELRRAVRNVVDREQRLRDQAERTARMLQESLLPPVIPSIPGAELAALYRPAAAGEVGGDFYDVFALHDGGWALVVGDVSGKGAGAAAVTALARHTIRAAAMTCDDPADVLAMLNRAMLLARTGGRLEHFCTAHVSFMRPSAAGMLLTSAAAAHPPALVLRGDETAEEVAAVGAPVGWHDDATFAAVETRLDEGDLLVIYTDGLSEARRAGGMLGAEGLVSVLDGGARAGAEAATERLRQALSGPDVDVRDDAAALVVKVR